MNSHCYKYADTASCLCWVLIQLKYSCEGQSSDMGKRMSYFNLDVNSKQKTINKIPKHKDGIYYNYWYYVLTLVHGNVFHGTKYK